MQILDEIYAWYEWLDKNQEKYTPLQILIGCETAKELEDIYKRNKHSTTKLQERLSAWQSGRGYAANSLAAFDKASWNEIGLYGR